MEISKQNFWFSLKNLQILRFMMLCWFSPNKTKFRVKCVISRTRVHMPTIFIGDSIKKFFLEKLLINWWILRKDYVPLSNTVYRLTLLSISFINDNAPIAVQNDKRLCWRLSYRQRWSDIINHVLNLETDNPLHFKSIVKKKVLQKPKKEETIWNYYGR